MSAAPTRLGLVGPIPPPNGGMAMQTLQLQRLLRAENIEVSLLATNAPIRPVFMTRVPGLRALCRLLPYLFAVWRLAGRVDVIQLMANSGWSWQLFAAPVLWLARLRGTPVIVNYHGGEAREYFRRSFARVRPSLRLAADVVVPSGYLQAVFTEFGQYSRVIPNFIDRELFRPVAVGEPAAGDTGVGAGGGERLHTLVITRNLEPIYGIDTAIRALARVLAKRPGVQLRIAGSGPAEAALKALAREQGVAEQVSFEGRLDRDGIVALYAGADAMLNPTTVDNMPNSVLEALACGLPVISTDVGGIPYILKHEETGLLLPPRDEAALAAAILRLLDDSALQQRLRDNGLAQVEAYAWPNIRQQWLQAYSDACLAERRAAV